MFLPIRIPIIVKLKQYIQQTVNTQIIKRLDRYLWNNIKTSNTLIIDKWNLKEFSEIKKDNVIYNLVNNINSVGYKINKDLLNFINIYVIDYGLLDNQNIKNYYVINLT